MDLLNRYIEYYDKASVQYRKGNYQKALYYYDKSLKRNPKYVKAWNDKGAALANSGIYNEALKCYDKALEINPKYTLTLINKANLLSKRFQRYEEAIDYYSVIQKLDKRTITAGIKGSKYKYPNVLADIWNNKGYAFSCLESYIKAIECYNKALEIDPSHLIALQNKENADNLLKETELICPDCGTKNYSHYDYCQGCGNKLNKKINIKFCSNCNSQIDTEVIFCPTCGSKVDENITNFICPKCNTTLNDDVNFCSDCGENLKILNKIDINNDNEEEIATLPGFGHILAKKAVNIRKSKDGYNSIEEFIQLNEIKPHIAKKIEKLVICGGTKKPKQPFQTGRIVDY